MTTPRRLARFLVSLSFIAAGAFAGQGCTIYANGGIPARQGGLLVGDYNGYGYSPNAFTGAVHYNGGVYGNNWYPAGYYSQGTPFIPTGPGGGHLVTGGQPVLMSPTMPGIPLTRDQCDTMGCNMTSPGAPGPTLVPAVGANPGVGSRQAVFVGPGGYVQPGLIPVQR